jgi:orotidine-5'-phosphate decarboxylase
MQPKDIAKHRLYVALDVDSESAALEIVRECSAYDIGFKIGLQLFAFGGPNLVSKIVEQGKPVFLDLKFHDIPNTVAAAAAEATKLGVEMFNVHAFGGAEMMQRTADILESTAAKAGIDRPKVIAVTVLTSSDDLTLKGIGVDSDVESQVVRLAKLSSESGMDGVVASAREASIIRSAISDPKFLIVTPGIRPQTATNDDQRRVTTPSEAISAGADHIVVGRPITAAPDRKLALEQILKEIEIAQK